MNGGILPTVANLGQGKVKSHFVDAEFQKPASCPRTDVKQADGGVGLEPGGEGPATMNLGAVAVRWGLKPR